MEAQSPLPVSKAKPKKKAEERRRPWLTAGQLHELEMQSAAYRYIEAGLPIPDHLVVPIWNSLALSSWSHYLTMSYNHYSPWLGYSGFNHRDMMDPEPSRCRRTDGKKWRCSKNIVPFQKYCGRHMHRGSKRSRKLVESSQTASSSPIVSIKQETSDGLNNSVTQSLQRPATISSSKTSMVTVASFTDSGTRKVNNNIGGDKVSSPSYAASASTNKSVSYDNTGGENINQNDKEGSNRFLALGHSRLPSCRSDTEPRWQRCQEASKKKWRSGEDLLLSQRYNSGSLCRASEISDRCPDLTKFLDNSKTNRNSPGQSEVNGRSTYLSSNYNTVNWGNINVGGCFVPGMHFSPDSVLQDRGGWPFHKSNIENEPGRCRRTDGKKWRCSKDVLPGQKYCQKHMHRGAKKRLEDNNSTSIPYAVTTTAGSMACKEAVHNRKEGLTFNSRLSVCVPADPRLQCCEDKDTSNSSSDTTITDNALKGVENELSSDSDV